MLETLYEAFLLVLIVAGLWIGGAFSNSKKPAATPPTAPTTTQTQTTTPKPKAPPAPATVLNPGAKGAQVKRLQRALKYLGYSPGTIDGDYGPSTQAALQKFQKAHGLAADGVHIRTINQTAVSSMRTSAATTQYLDPTPESSGTCLSSDEILSR